MCLFACLFQQAAVKALETAKDLGHKTLEIKTDSKYTINGKDLINLQGSIFIFEIFFCKKISLSRRVEYVVDGSMDQ